MGILEKTGLTDRLFSGNKTEKTLPESDSKPVVPQLNTSSDSTSDTTVAGDGSDEVKPVIKPEATKTTTENKTAVTEKTEKQNIKTPEKTVEKTADKQTTVKTPTAKAPVVKTETPASVQTRKSTLFFVKIDTDGRVLRQEVSREIPSSNSPLSETLTVLFKGPTSQETGKELRTLIPPGTKLLSAIVKDGVATLNLSEEFQFNQFGIEGYLGQLSQIVFTATAFPTVKSVQFLIDGQRHEYLGAEGVWIGTPLSRDKF